MVFLWLNPINPWQFLGHFVKPATWPRGASWQESTPSPAAAAAELPSELAGAVAKAVEASQVGLGMGRFSPRKMVIFKMENGGLMGFNGI